MLAEAGSPEMPEQLDLAQCALAEHGMVERRDALDGDFGARRNVDSRPGTVSTSPDSAYSHYDSIGALANDLVNFVVFRHIERDVGRGHRPRLSCLGEGRAREGGRMTCGVDGRGLERASATDGSALEKLTGGDCG